MAHPRLLAAVIAASLFAQALPAQPRAVHAAPDRDDRDSGNNEAPVRTPNGGYLPIDQPAAADIRFADNVFAKETGKL